jgi:hypothetical protein
LSRHAGLHVRCSISRDSITSLFLFFFSHARMHAQLCLNIRPIRGAPKTAALLTSARGWGTLARISICSRRRMPAVKPPNACRCSSDVCMSHHGCVQTERSDGSRGSRSRFVCHPPVSIIPHTVSPTHTYNQYPTAPARTRNPTTSPHHRPHIPNTSPPKKTGKLPDTTLYPRRAKSLPHPETPQPFLSRLVSRTM